MRIDVTVADADVQVLKKSLLLESNLGQRISTARFIILGEEVWATPSLAISPTPAIGGYTRPLFFDECKIDRELTPYVNCAINPSVAMGGNSTYLNFFFGGYIVSIEKTKLGPAQDRVMYICKAQDYNVLPLKKLVTESYVNKTEQEIIDDLFTTYLSEIDTTTYVESDGVNSTIDWTRRPLIEALDELAKIFEKEWYIDYEKYLHYFTPVTTAAPFILSDVPWLTPRLPYKNIRHAEEGLDIVNRVVVVGDTGGPIVEIRTDTTSYDEYGRYFEDKIVDPNIDTAAWAQAVGDAYLVERAFVKVTGSLTCYQEGLVKGQKVRIINAFRNLDAFYLIQSVRLSMISPDQEKIDIQYGDYKSRLTDLLLKISKEERKE